MTLKDGGLGLLEFSEQLSKEKSIKNFSQEDINYYWDRFFLYRYVSYKGKYINLRTGKLYKGQ